MAGINRSARRRRSVNLRRLWWVLTREAVLNIAFRDEIGLGNDRPARQLLSCQWDYAVLRLGDEALRLHPERRYYWPAGLAGD